MMLKDFTFETMLLVSIRSTRKVMGEQVIQLEMNLHADEQDHRQNCVILCSENLFTHGQVLCALEGTPWKMAWESIAILNPPILNEDYVTYEFASKTTIASDFATDIFISRIELTGEMIGPQAQLSTSNKKAVGFHRKLLKAALEGCRISKAVANDGSVVDYPGAATLL